MKSLRIFSAIFGLIGITLLVVGIVWYSRVAGFVKKASNARGVVTNMVAERASRSTTTVYRPTVRFATGEGKNALFTGSVASSPPQFAVGDSVDVLYDATDPGNADIDEFWSLYLGPIILSGIGLIFSSIAAFIIGYQLRSRRRAAEVI